MSSSQTTKKLIVTSTSVNIYSSINFLTPYLQKQPLMQDLCFFIDYLGVDIETVYNDLRYQYIDWSKLSDEALKQIFQGLGMDYIVDIINIASPTDSSQLLGLCSLIWLLKGQLLGLDIIMGICGIEYTIEVWHEQVPLGTPNTATLHLDFGKYTNISENLKLNFGDFLKKYLYPIINIFIQIRPIEGTICTAGYQICSESCTFKEVQRYPGWAFTYDCIGNIAAPTGEMYHCSTTGEYIKIDNIDQNWEEVDRVWQEEDYYAVGGIWGTGVFPDAYYQEIGAHDTGEAWLYKVTPNLVYTTAVDTQSIKVYIQYSADDEGYYWSDWEEVGEDTFAYFRYCKFKAEFNASSQQQIFLYSFGITIS